MSDRLAIVLLPGLDGTGTLFDPLIEVLPATLEPIVVSYPPDRPLGYRELEEYVAAVLPTDREFAIVAESFSGPIGVRLAARHSQGLRALVLVASFVTNPSPRVLGYLRFLVRSPLFRFGPPRSLIRRRLVGRDAPDDLVSKVVAANRLVSAPVIARRVREVLAVDATEEFKSIGVPTLYLRAEQDRQVAPRVADDLNSMRPEMELVSIPAPHLVLQAEPEAAALAIEHFVHACVRCSDPGSS